MGRTGSMLTLGAVVVFGIVWTMITLMIPAPIGPIFTLFGIVFIMIGATRMVNVAKTPENVAPPVQQPPASDESVPGAPQHGGASNGYCPYCGSPLSDGFLYCGVCGRRLRWTGTDRWEQHSWSWGRPCSS